MKILTILSLTLIAGIVSAQTVPNGSISAGQVWSVQQWINAWTSKADVSNPVFTGLITSPAISLPALNQSPAQNVTNGSVGLGTIFQLSTRSGGFGQYGNDLMEYNVTAATPAGQFDSGLTTWVTHQNLTGGQVFGTWRGANSPAKYTGEIYTGGAVIGDELNCGNRWADFGLQADVGGLRYVACEQIVPDIVPSTDTALTVVTITGSASPCVVNWTANALSANQTVVFQGAGTLPLALTFGTTYYVNSPATNTIQLAASWNGTPITCAAGSSGTIGVIPYFPATFGTVYGQSVHGARFWTLELNRTDTLMPGGHHFVSNGGSIAATAPQDVINVGGNWINGIDLSGGSFTGPALKTSNFTQQTFGQAMTVGGNANFYTAQFNGSSTSGQSLGVNIQAGTTSADFGLYVTNQAGSTQYFLIRGDGGVLVGNPTGGDKGLGALNVQSGVYDNNVRLLPVLSGTTPSIGGGALTAGTCASTTVAITGLTTAMSVTATPVTYPGDGNTWLAYTSAAGTATVKVCAIVAGTPVASTYNVRALQ